MDLYSGIKSQIYLTIVQEGNLHNGATDWSVITNYDISKSHLFGFYNFIVRNRPF